MKAGEVFFIFICGELHEMFLPEIDVVSQFTANFLV